jgi:hypothetical protein
MVTDAYNPSYSEDRDQENCALMTTWTKNTQDPHLSKQLGHGSICQ